jgi:flagellin-like protein
MINGSKMKKTTIWGGLFSALLLCALMALMPFSSMVDNQVSETDYTESETAEQKDDPFRLPETIEQVEWEYALEDELQGMRDINQKAFVHDGQISVLTSSDPLHYLEAGTWEDIDTNIVPTAFGWEVVKNVFKTAFPSDVGAGVAVQMDPNVDPIIVGIAPQIVTLDEAGVAPSIHRVGPTHDAISVGGNVIRYPVADGYDLDYEVSSLEMKQNLVIRQQPVLDESVAWFGLREIIRLPADYALFIGDEMVGEEIVSTQEMMTIRSLETGEVLAEIPVPVVLEPGAEEEYTATYFVSFTNGQIILTTAIDTDWLMDEDRVFPLSLDPTIKRVTNAGGYCYRYYANCYSGNYRYFYRNYGTIYYLPWNKYQFTSANAMPSGSTTTSVKWKQYISYSNTWGSNSYNAAIMMTCGTAARYSWSIASATCSSTPLPVSMGYGGTAQRKMVSSIWNSPSVGTFSTGTGWKTVTLSSSASSVITNAANNSDAIGMTHRNMNNNYYYMYAYNTGSYNSYLEITYFGGSDSTAPAADFTPYEVTSYKEGARTFFTTLSDSAGIDTTSSGNPRLYYKVNSGSWTGVSATSIGTCSSSAAKCQFKATTVSINAGDSVDYYWAFQDLAYSAGMAQSNNFATLPAGGSGSPSSTTAPTNVFTFDVDDVANAGTAKKMTILTTDVHAGNRFTPTKWFDRQVTYYDSSDEYVFEFDTSDCGTGANSCFYATSYYFYSQWQMQWTTTPSNGYNGMGGTASGNVKFHKDDGGYLSITTNNGPGMNLIYVYDSASNKWAMVGLDTSTGIDEPLSGGDEESGARSTYGYTQAYNVKVPGDITGTFGKFDFNATYSSSKSNWMCVTTNGWLYFFRSTSSNPLCTSSYYNIYSTSYKWSGFAMGTGYYGRMASSGVVSSKVGNVAPTPDVSPPEVDHGAMKDSHSRDRTFSFKVLDAGDPPAGLNTTSAVGVGPTLYYTITDADGTVNAQQSKVLSPDDTRANCVSSSCTWSAELTDLERGSEISYHMTAEDISTASSGINTVTTSANSFEVGDPTKVFIVEWHDMGYTSTYTCNYQVKMYDVTNEIEFHYDTNCKASYDYATVGYQDSTRTKGATLRSSAGYINGANPHANNYRITTDANGHGSETFTAGLTEITNYQTAIAGSSNGYPYGYYCASSYYWNTYKAGCDANIDMPDGFTFEYFGNTFNGSDSTSRVMINRMGAMYLKSTSSTSPERAMTTWYSNMPDLPYSSNTFSRANLIAPWWGYYSSYYCYDNSALDCGVRYRVMPFEGKGTDIDADITQDTSWDLVDSPIRVNPSGDYLSVNANLNIEAGVVVQVAQGKGISFDGGCDTFTVTGNDTDGDNNHVLFEGQYSQTWTGIAFTNSCTTGTDDRHQFSYVDFANTTDYAIAAGSRHGSSPSSNANVGNFTMDHVTFTNVKGAVSHGSGQGTVFDISHFEVNDASESCFLFPEDSIVTLYDGSMDGCNQDYSMQHGAVTDATSGASGTSSGTVGGSLTIENVSIANSEANLIRSFAEDIYISNVSASNTAGLHDSVFARYSLRLLGSGGSGSHQAVINNFDATMYDYGAKITAADSYSLTNVNVGDHRMALFPGTTTTVGPVGDDAVVDTLTAGSMEISRTLPTMSDIDLGTGDLTIMGNSPSSAQATISDLEAGGISVTGCGYNLHFIDAAISDTSDTGYLSGSCSSSAAPNTIFVEGGTMASSTSSNNMIYARNSKITLGGVDITGQTAMGNYVAKASTNGRITLIDVSFGGNDCADAGGDTGDCWLEVSSSSGSIWLGGIGTATTFKEKDGIRTLKPGTTVTSFVMDGSGASLFMVGSQVTDSNGEADVWTISGSCDTNGCSSHDHGTYFDAYGPAGIHSAANTTFGIGDDTFLRLTQPPITLSDSGMDCTWLSNNASMSALDPDGDDIYVLDDGSILLEADLSLDGCTLRLTESKFIVRSDATSTPTLTISNGGELEMIKGAGGTFSELKAASSAYPLHISIEDGGTLDLQGTYARNFAQDSTQQGALIVGPGATVSLTDGSVVYGDAASSTDMATIKVDRGTLYANDASVINNGGTGTGIWFEQTASTLSDITVSNAEVGMKSHNAAPVVNGFTLSNNEVGLDFFGGMSLPTIYRSTILSGESTGWQTHSLDLTSLIGKQYVQLGFESVFAGGNAHPRYNYYTSKYYNIYDRMQYEVTLTDGTVFNYSLDQAGKDSAGYWDDSTSDNSDYGGWGNYSCSYYGYTQNPAFRDYGYYYYFHNYGPYGSNGYYDEPDQLGFRWEAGETSTASSLYYPYHYWGYYWPTSQFGNNYQGGLYAPPEGFNGLWGNYNVCIDYAYTYYQNPGTGARMAMPIIDVQNQGTNSGTSGTIAGLKLYIDVLHKGADYYQDRYDFVARASNDHNDMGDWARESGKPTFTEGTITGADVGIEIGGNYAAAVVENVDISSPSETGLRVDGSTAASFDYLNVSGGNYGAYATMTSRGKLHLTNIDFDNQVVAGVSYLKDTTGALSGSITNSAGAAVSYGALTTAEINLGIDLASNAIGVATAGSGDINLNGNTFANSQDFLISGSSTVTFVDGTVDETTVSVTGNGVFNRARSLVATITADTNNVVGAEVYLMDGGGKPTGTGVTDANGDAVGITYFTAVVNKAGLTNPALSGYKLATVAKVGTYSTSNADFRYYYDGVTLDANAPTTAAVSLTNKFDVRVCYGFSSSSYNMIAQCAGYLSTNGKRTIGSLVEYGYYGAVDWDMSGKTIMVDAPFMYLKGHSGTSINDWSDSTIINTGSYDYYGTTNYRSTFPYNASFKMENSTMIALSGVDENTGVPNGFDLGYYAWSDVNPWYKNSTFIGLQTIAAANEYGNRMPKNFIVEDNIIVSNTPVVPGSTSFAYDEMCVVNGAVNNAVVARNTFTGCAIGVRSQNTVYSYSYAASTWGADDMLIEGNTFDGGVLDVWFALGSYSDDNVVRNNTHMGATQTEYAIYAQDRNTVRPVIEGNTIYNAKEPIYMRGAVGWDISNNTIYGDGNAAHAGIYVKDGYGSINGNTLVDADGGILVDGLSYGYSASVTNNEIYQSNGRTAVSAVGIWAEDCGTSVLETGGNDITIMGNALVTDGCDIEDTSSVLTGTGGSGGMVYTVNIMEGYFTPQNLTINEGDTVRWRLQNYSTGTNYQHGTVSNDTDANGVPLWNSGAMNLGATYTHTFDTAGTYEYKCTNHPGTMWGTITVSTGSTSSFTSIGLDVVGTNDDVSLNGTEISGFTTAYEQSGGSLFLNGGADLIGGDYAVDIDGTDVSSDGGKLSATSATGVGLYFTGGGALALVDLSTDAPQGVYIDGSTDGLFDWNGGTVHSGTGLYAVDKAEGDIQNMTWSDASTQIYVGSDTKITSVGNTIDLDKMIVVTGAEVHEANLLDLGVNHLGVAASNVGLMITSDSGNKAAYVSPDMRNTGVLAVAGDSGDLSDWVGNVDNPSDDLMPGVMSSDGAGENFMATWDETNLFLALSGVSMDDGDLMIFLDTADDGSTDGWEWDGTTPSLGYSANYAFWAEDGSDSPNDGDTTYSYSLKKWRGDKWDDSLGCTNMAAHIGWGGSEAQDSNTELKIPWDCIGSPSNRWVRMSVVVLEESGGVEASKHPSSGYLSMNLGKSNLGDGTLSDERLNYRSYIGSNTPSPSEDYNILAKVDADCAEDWGNINGLNMSENRDENIDILRACPVITGIEDVSYDEDSGAHTISLTNKADDVQDSASSLLWTLESDVSADGDLLTVALVDHDLTITPKDQQFGTYLILLTVEDSNGLSASKSMLITINNVNDAPTICNTGRSDCMPVFSDDGFDNLNVLDEGFGSHSKPLGLIANSAGSYITDQANEQTQTLSNSEDVPQAYIFGASVPSDCGAFSVAVANNELTITEVATNEAGGVCTITLTLSDGASINDAATNVDVDFTVNPVNDVPVIPEYDVNTAAHLITGEGVAIATPWSVSVIEDTGCVDAVCDNTDALTFDLSGLKADNDHNNADLTWTWVETTSCDVDNYFEDISFNGDNLEFTLIQDAATNVPSEEIDYLDDGGIHQQVPLSGEFCPIKVVLSDSPSAPSYYPNYNDLPTATYNQETTSTIFSIRVENTREMVADYLLDVDHGFDFNSVNFIMPGTNIPIDVDIQHEGDEGPYKYDQLLKVQFMSNGAGGLTIRDTQFIEPPAWGQSVNLGSKVLIDESTTRVGVRVDVLTCKAASCPSPSAQTPSDFISNSPAAHRAADTPNSPWSEPGAIGYDATTGVYSQRRPALEDGNWSNNAMFSSLIASDPSGILNSGQDLPVMVDTMAPSAVPSFAPGLVAISAAGLFVAGLVLASQRRMDDDEEFVQSALVDDEQAVSPVIATILMVAITVVLSGVVYVWASDLADQPSKSVPRIAFKVEKTDAGTNGYWSIIVTSAKEPIATQATVVMVEWVNDTGSQIESFKLSDSEGTYGFAPVNSESFITFSDSIKCEAADECTSTYGDGDAIHIRMSDPSGFLLKDNGPRVTLKYVPQGLGTASVLKTFNLEI